MEPFLQDPSFLYVNAGRPSANTVNMEWGSTCLQSLHALNTVFVKNTSNTSNKQFFSFSSEVTYSDGVINLVHNISCLGPFKTLMLNEIPLLPVLSRKQSDSDG